MSLHHLLRPPPARVATTSVASTSRRGQKKSCPDLGLFSPAELEHCLDHFKTCNSLHFASPRADYYRNFGRVCKLHYDYMTSFAGIEMVEICCGEEIPFTDFAKLGDEEKRCVDEGGHIPGYRHIYLELKKALAFNTSKQKPNRNNFPATSYIDPEIIEKQRAMAAKSLAAQTARWAEIMEKIYEDLDAKKAEENLEEDGDVDEEQARPLYTPGALYSCLIKRQRSETV